MRKQRMIVSSNYRNRNSPFKWLLRGEKDPPEEAVAYKVILAIDVRFVPASEKDEYGFGCYIVANCGVVEGYEVPMLFSKEGLRELVFAEFCFVDKETDYLVDEVSELYLTAEGKIYGSISIPNF